MAACALIKTIYELLLQRKDFLSANVGLMLGQCNRNQNNIKYTLSSYWRFVSGERPGDDALSPVDVITCSVIRLYSVLVTLISVRNNAEG